MTFDQIVEQVKKRMNLTSSDATTRIEEEVNDMFKQLMTECGVDTIARTTATASTAIDDRYMTFTNVLKLLSVYNTNYDPYIVLSQMSFQELRNQIPGTDPAQEYAISLTGATTCQIFLSSIPSSVYELTADVIATVDTMSGDDEPAFPENFHIALVYGVMAEEYDKMEKPDMATKFQGKYETQRGKLMYWLAKSAYKDIVQGKDNFTNPWWSQPVT